MLSSQERFHEPSRLRRLSFIVALLFSILSPVATLLAVQSYDNNNPLYQLREIWFQDVVSGAVWSFALDGISLGLFVLTAVLFPLGIISSELSHAHQRAEGKEPERIKLFWISLLFLETTVLGVFAAENLIVYYVFWEVMLLPMVLLIGIWGGADRKPATIKFFLYVCWFCIFVAWHRYCSLCRRVSYYSTTNWWSIRKEYPIS